MPGLSNSQGHEVPPEKMETWSSVNEQCMVIPINCLDHGNLVKPVRFLMTQWLVENLVDNIWDANEEGVAQTQPASRACAHMYCCDLEKKICLLRASNFPSITWGWQQGCCEV